MEEKIKYGKIVSQISTNSKIICQKLKKINLFIMLQIFSFIPIFLLPFFLSPLLLFILSLSSSSQLLCPRVISQVICFSTSGCKSSSLLFTYLPGFIDAHDNGKNCISRLHLFLKPELLFLEGYQTHVSKSELTNILNQLFPFLTLLTWLVLDQSVHHCSL